MAETHSYKILYGLAIATAILSGTITLIQSVGPETLGFAPLAARWFGVLGGVLALCASFLPRVSKPPDPARKGMD